MWGFHFFCAALAWIIRQNSLKSSLKKCVSRSFLYFSVTFIVFRGFGKWNICECSSFATTVTDGKNIFHFFPLKINVNRNKKNNLWSPLVSNFLKASSTCNIHVIFNINISFFGSCQLDFSDQVILLFYFISWPSILVELPRWVSLSRRLLLLT